MHVRPAVLDDCASIARITVDSWRAAYAGTVSQAFLEALDANQRQAEWEAGLPRLDRSSREVLVIEDPSGVIGWASVGIPRDDDVDPLVTGELWAIYLTPTIWRQGAGRVLMAACVSWLHAAGYRNAVLWVLEANARGRGFYEATGWLPDGSRRQITLGGPVPEIRYARTLVRAPDR